MLNTYIRKHTLILFALCFYGMTMLFSSSSILAYDAHNDPLFFVKKQSIFLCIGVVAFLFLRKINPLFLLKNAYFIMVISLLSLIGVFIPQLSHHAGGSSRWLQLFSFQVQPSEFLKIALICFISFLLYRNEEKKDVKNYHYLFGGTGLAFFLLLLQPDFGNALIVLALLWVALFLSGAKKTYLFASFLCAAPLLFFLAATKSYRLKRLLTFLNPWEDPSGSGYQVLQSLNAFYRGGVIGQGLGNSQEKLYFLPKVRTDFISSVIGEELGVFGIALLIGLFLSFIWYSFCIAVNSKRLGLKLLSLLCASLIGIECFFNLGVSLSLLPTKGLPLPFFSQGGSSLIASLLAAAIIQSVAFYENKKHTLYDEQN